MKKNRLGLLFLSSTAIAIPMLAVSCNIVLPYSIENVKLLNSSQKEEIKNKFKFELTSKAKNMNKEEWMSYWMKLKNDRKKNNPFYLDGIIRGNIDPKFKEYFNVSYHKLDGFGSSHKYRFKLNITNSGRPVIEYNVLCVDLNNKQEFSQDVIVPLQDSQW